MPLRKKPLSEYTSTPKDRERARMENSFNRFLAMFCEEHPDLSELKVALYDTYELVRAACPWGPYGERGGWEYIQDWRMGRLLDAAGFVKGSRLVPVKPSSGLVSYVPRVVYMGVGLVQAKVDAYTAAQKIAKAAQDVELAAQKAKEKEAREYTPTPTPKTSHATKGENPLTECYSPLVGLAGLAADPRTARTKRIDTDSGITYIRSECDDMPTGSPATSSSFVTVGGALYARALISTIAPINRPFTKAGHTTPCTHIVTFNNPQLRAVFVTKTDAAEIITQLTGGKQSQ